LVVGFQVGNESALISEEDEDSVWKGQAGEKRADFQQCPDSEREGIIVVLEMLSRGRIQKVF